MQQERGSSPKLIAWNNALVTSLAGRWFEEARADTRWWGRLVENAVGSHLLNNLHTSSAGICYWRERDREVDFVVASPNKTTAIEVESGREGKAHGLRAFLQRYPDASVQTIGGNGIPLEEFFLNEPAELPGL